MNFEGINRLPNVGQGRRLAEMKQEDPDMMKALEEDLMDFHGRIEKSSTWWCPRMQDTTTTTKKKVVAARINFQSHHPRMLNQKCVKFHAQVTSHPPVTLYVGDIPPGLGLRHTFQPYGLHLHQRGGGNQGDVRAEGVWRRRRALLFWHH